MRFILLTIAYKINKIMPVLKSKEDVKSLLSTKKGGTKPVIFGDEINKLKTGEGLFISLDEWTIKTTPI